MGILQSNYFQIAEIYIQKHKLDIYTFDDAHLNTWFDSVNQYLEVLKSQSINEVNYGMIEIIALLGVLFEKHLDWKWNDEIEKTGTVQGLLDGTSKEIDLKKYILNLYEGVTTIDEVKNVFMLYLILDSLK